MKLKEALKVAKLGAEDVLSYNETESGVVIVTAFGSKVRVGNDRKVELLSGQPIDGAKKAATDSQVSDLMAENEALEQNLEGLKVDLGEQRKLNEALQEKLDEKDKALAEAAKEIAALKEELEEAGKENAPAKESK